MKALKVRAIGSSAGIVFPKDILAKLRCRKGDTLYVIETPNGIELKPYDPNFAQNMAALDEIIACNRNLMKSWLNDNRQKNNIGCA